MKIFLRLVTMLALFAMLSAGCEPESDSDIGDAVNLDCENNWDSSGGNYSNGVLYQTVTITFTVPDSYDGEEYAYGGLGANFSPDDDIPTKTIPVLVGETHFNAGPLVPGASFTFTTDRFDRLPMIDEYSCGGYYYIGVEIYGSAPVFPVIIEGLAYSDVKYQIGGDAIVVDVGELLSERK